MDAWNQHMASSAVVLCLCAILASTSTASTHKEADLLQSIFPHYALAFRTAVLSSENDALRLLAAVPGTTALIDLNAPDSESTELLEQLWIPFFQNVMVEIGGEDPQQPAVLYYNPLSDAGLYTRWAVMDDGRYQVVQLMAFPGERLGNQSLKVFDLPEWMMADDIASALADIVYDRRAAFAEFDLSQRLPDGAFAVYQSASSDFMAIAPRLVQDAAWREQWAGFAWLPNTLKRIQQILKERDPVELLNSAPETTPEMAELLSDLPDAVIENLVLDRVLTDRTNDNLLIGSNPEDGTTYVWVTCHEVDGACVIGGFAVLSFAQAAY